MSGEPNKWWNLKDWIEWRIKGIGQDGQVDAIARAAQEIHATANEVLYDEFREASREY